MVSPSIKIPFKHPTYNFHQNNNHHKQSIFFGSHIRPEVYNHPKKTEYGLNELGKGVGCEEDALLIVLVVDGEFVLSWYIEFYAGAGHDDDGACFVGDGRYECAFVR